MHRIGIDLGGTKIEGVVLGAAGEVLARERVPTESARGYEHIVEVTAGLVERLRALAAGGATVGVGTPGAVSSRTGLMKNCNTVCLNGRDLPGDLTRRLGAPVLVENDANCFALAEAVSGAGRGARVVFGVIMGTGVGGGLVVDGRLWSGPQHIAGEWGHQCLDPAGPACYCGQRGCVETYLSGPAVERGYRERTGVALALPAIVARAGTGDAAARRGLDELCAHFGRALANVISLLDPSIVVLGGGLSNIGALYDAGRAAVARCVFNDELRTPIVRNQHGDSAGVLGAALLGAPG
ncbi:MAG: ROK family protein [Candidatus Binatia bacterium]